MAMVRREEIIRIFSDKFQELIKTFSINDSYASLVKQYPYRILGSFDLQGKSHRSQRLVEGPPEEDVKTS